jgi:hypothetical protein
MCPITAGGRVITCMCALFGAATMGMLTSVLVDRYQRVYNRKMYVSESESSSADFDIISDLDDDVKSIRSMSGLRRRFSGTIPHSLSSFQGKRKTDRHPTCKLQFVLSYNERCATDHIVTIMKKKFAEAIVAIDVDVNLKLIDDDRKELWTISSFDSQATTTSKMSLSMDVEQLSNIESF